MMRLKASGVAGTWTSASYFVCLTEQVQFIDGGNLWAVWSPLLDKYCSENSITLFILFTIMNVLVCRNPSEFIGFLPGKRPNTQPNSFISESYDDSNVFLLHFDVRLLLYTPASVRSFPASMSLQEVERRTTNQPAGRPGPNWRKPLLGLL